MAFETVFTEVELDPADAVSAREIRPAEGSYGKFEAAGRGRVL